MKGTMTERGKDTWRLMVSMGSGPDGSRRRYTETIKGKKSDARKRLNELLVGHEKQGLTTAPGRLTVTDILRLWLNGYVKTNCSQRTYDGYESILVHHLIPGLGHIPLKQLQPPAIQHFYGEQAGRLSLLTVHHQHRVLSQALKYAVRQGYLSRNPCELVDPPSPRSKPMRTLTPAELAVLIEHTESSLHFPVIYTAVSSGLREAELLALRWRDLDLDMLSISVSQVLYKRRGVHIFKEPKTARSRRRVAMTVKLALFLRDYRAEREALYQALGKQLALDDLVFASPEGKPRDPSTLSHAFGRLAAKAGFPGLRFHDLRHTFASIMLLRGAPAKVISEALGHCSVAFTMDVYSHIISGMQEDAMALLNEALPMVRAKNGTKMAPKA